MHRRTRRVEDRLADILLIALLAVPISHALAAVGLDSGAPTVAERQPQTLWQFLQALPGSFESQLFIGLTLAGLVGMGAHYLLKWARDEIKENLFCYLWGNKKSTLFSFFTYLGLAIGAIASGAFMVEGTLFGITGDVFVGWKMVMWMGVTNGFTIDAIVNKTRRAEWGPAEREVKKGAAT